MSTHEVWQGTVDAGKWNVSVHGEDDQWSRGLLLVADADGQVVHREVVAIAYGAPFGPDVADVAEWQARAIAVIDDPSIREP